MVEGTQWPEHLDIPIGGFRVFFPQYNNRSFAEDIDRQGSFEKRRAFVKLSPKRME